MIHFVAWHEWLCIYEQDRLDYIHLLQIQFTIFIYLGCGYTACKHVYWYVTTESSPFTPLIANPYPLLPRDTTTSLMLDCLGSRDNEIKCWTESNNKTVRSVMITFCNFEQEFLSANNLVTQGRRSWSGCSGQGRTNFWDFSRFSERLHAHAG